MKNILIVGAGVNGLTLAYKLLNKHNITILEKEECVGGLARSFKYGPFTYDIGPHRFHTDDQEVLDFIKKVLDKEYTIVLRKSEVYLFGRYHDWPIRATSLFKLPLNITFKAFMDLVFKKRYIGNTFPAYVLNKYGKTLYECFFKGYTEKFLEMPIEQVHVNWGSTGLDRAIIDKRVKMDDLLGLLKSSLMPRPLKTEFIYPIEGIQVFSDKLVKDIEDRGGKVITGAEIKKINYTKGKIKEIIYNNGSVINPDIVAWTAPLDTLCNLLNVKNPGLKYRSLIIYNLEIDGEPKKDYQWCYYGEKDIVFVRITNPYFFSKKTVPHGKTGLCIELACLEGDDMWNNPEKRVETIKRDLIKAKLIDKIEDVKGVHMEKIPAAYPIYRYDYADNFSKLSEELKKFKNLILSGRCGKFRYNNMDHTIRDAIDTAKRIMEEG